MESAAPNKKFFGTVAYFLAAGANIVPQRSKIAVTIDGERHETEGLGVLVINFSKIQFDISFTHTNQPRDGMLDVIVMKAKNAFELLPAVFAAMLDRDGDFPERGDSLEIYQGKEVRVEADPAFEIQYDGEVPKSKTPFVARILPKAVRVVISDEGKALFG